MSVRAQYSYLRTIQALSKKRKQQVYVVGGFLRDRFLGRQGHDVDFAVLGDAVALARAVARALKGAFVLLDEEHPCGRVVKKEKDMIWTFDFADLRAKTIKGDLKLRDFTINALCVELQDLDETGDLKKELLDTQGSLKDLRDKRIRMTSARAFKDDPLRMMRAFSLAAQLDFKIDPKTLAVIKKEARLLSRVSVERIREELFKVLSSGRCVKTMLLMQKTGLLDEVIPQLVIMRGVHQGGYHHLDVWKHSLEVARAFEDIARQEGQEDIRAYLNEEIGGGHTRYALLVFACLLHDIGKPQTKKKETDGRMSFHGHEHVGADITRHVARQLKLSVKERYFLEDMVRWHLRPGYLSNFKRPSERMIFRFLRDTAQEALSVVLLAMADQQATRGPLSTEAKAAHHRKICLQMIERFRQERNKKPKVRLLSGHDLIKRLKLMPSPLFAKILGAVEEAQALGKITTADEAFALAAKMAQGARS